MLLIYQNKTTAFLRFFSCWSFSCWNYFFNDCKCWVHRWRKEISTKPLPALPMGRPWFTVPAVYAYNLSYFPRKHTSCTILLQVHHFWHHCVIYENITSTETDQRYLGRVLSSPIKFNVGKST